mmetsp:Transcript_12932/g.29365  ORF Transcript_12932/g.29365 Transcript_12932/m.29365 type:complete len:203 (-) Transcript_12932:193-801(-)
MFACRLCAQNPFTALFGGDEPQQQNQERLAELSGPRRTRRRRRSSTSTTSSSEGACPTVDMSYVPAFSPRKDAELQLGVRSWDRFAHPRAYELFCPEKLAEILTLVLQGVDRNEDPVLGQEERCVFWHGAVAGAVPQPVIRAIKPEQTEVSVMYVSRVLAFIFSTDSTFERLVRLRKAPFRMHCGDQRCVNLAHISLEVFEG